MIAACRTVLLLLTLTCACANNNSTGAALLRWLKASNGTVRQAPQCFILQYTWFAHQAPGPCICYEAADNETECHVCYLQANVAVGLVPGQEKLRGVLAGRNFTAGDAVIRIPAKLAVRLASQTAQVLAHSSLCFTSADSD